MCRKYKERRHNKTCVQACKKKLMFNKNTKIFSCNSCGREFKANECKTLKDGVPDTKSKKASIKNKTSNPQNKSKQSMNKKNKKQYQRDGSGGKAANIGLAGEAGLYFLLFSKDKNIFNQLKIKEIYKIIGNAQKEIEDQENPFDFEIHKTKTSKIYIEVKTSVNTEDPSLNSKQIDGLKKHKNKSFIFYAQKVNSKDHKGTLIPGAIALKNIYEADNNKGKRIDIAKCQRDVGAKNK